MANFISCFKQNSAPCSGHEVEMCVIGFGRLLRVPAAAAACGIAGAAVGVNVDADPRGWSSGGGTGQERLPSLQSHAARTHARDEH